MTLAPVFVFALYLCQLCLSVQAETLRSQSIVLEEGWNAVFLEVSPLNTAPADVFADAPVDKVALRQAPSSRSQFVNDPSVNLMAGAGWLVWYHEDRPDAFLSNLYAITGPQALLVHATEAATIEVTGVPVPLQQQWVADTFHYVGFGIDEVAPPTFAMFFSGSAAHDHNRIYRLDDGKWKQVLDPAATAMRAGEAFWIFCEGGSKYQGPLTFEAGTSVGLTLNDKAASLIFRNNVDHPLTATVQHLPTGEPAAMLAFGVTVFGDPEQPVKEVAVPQPDGEWSFTLPPLEAGASIQLPLQSRMSDMTEPLQASVLRISTDLGTVHWLPVVTLRPDLLTNP